MVLPQMPLSSQTNPNGNALVDSSNGGTAIIPEASAKSKVHRSGVITVTGECSCSMGTNDIRRTKSWVNYCPECHKYGTLTFQRTWDCPEGMLVCNSCDADYCAVHGKEHIYYGAPFLRPA